jgi:hypothetical protein
MRAAASKRCEQYPVASLLESLCAQLALDSRLQQLSLDCIGEQEFHALQQDPSAADVRILCVTFRRILHEMVERLPSPPREVIVVVDPFDGLEKDQHFGYVIELLRFLVDEADFTELGSRMSFKYLLAHTQQSSLLNDADPLEEHVVLGKTDIYEPKRAVSLAISNWLEQTAGAAHASTLSTTCSANLPEATTGSKAKQRAV